jgi:hypothetical protein
MDPLRQLSVFRDMMYPHHGLPPAVLEPIRLGIRKKGAQLLQKDGIYPDRQRWTFTTLLPVEQEPEFLLAPKQWVDRGVI